MISLVRETTQKDYLRIRRNVQSPYRGSSKARAIYVDGSRMRVTHLEVLGVYFRRVPRLLLYVRGHSA